jgi:hypothetical protein
MNITPSLLHLPSLALVALLALLAIVPSTVTAVQTEPPTMTAIPTETATAIWVATEMSTVGLAPTETPTATPVPPQTPTTIPAIQVIASVTPSTSGGPRELDLDALLPPGKGRELLLSDCGSCHSFVCALRVIGPAEVWVHLKMNHSGRVMAMNPEDYDAVFDYLAENINDTRPPIGLPPELAAQGCNSGIQ